MPILSPPVETLKKTVGLLVDVKLLPWHCFGKLLGSLVSDTRR